MIYTLQYYVFHFESCNFSYYSHGTQSQSNKKFRFPTLWRLTQAPKSKQPLEPPYAIQGCDNKKEDYLKQKKSKKGNIRKDKDLFVHQLLSDYIYTIKINFSIKT